MKLFPQRISGICLLLFIWFSLFSTCQAQVAPEQALKQQYIEQAQRIKTTYEAALFTLKPYTFAHYGLRMHRQTHDPKYLLSLWVDLARVANRLNHFASDVHTPTQIQAYALSRLQSLKGKQTEREKRRYQATLNQAEYMYLGLDLLSAMARADEFGLKHKEDAKLREIIRRYDFAKYAMDPEMIRAWAAQMANHVYWLRQLGEQDLTQAFSQAFRLAYPDEQDHLLSEQQFNNKIYGMSHIIFADSQYYLKPVVESQHQWIFDYYRNNIDSILARCKEDVIAEVGLNFLLAQLDHDPVVQKTQQAISQAIHPLHNMIPSVSGDINLERGEHRNVLAIMLLDWQGLAATSTTQASPAMVVSPPYGLMAK
ncbi:DUF3541 domain-containing protein [Motilimonas eburnea]|uniref:DUF3541 domain-containing protein n=1 Tax=Motilimonas eburnea TaxID=1737488 RepID=UPI001E58C5AB|nr:DUF3541 domain-containing protein [Motilimonas eburnea]MCE2569883.1 DUF3541 domain-containing protein [Motilimonas eburnea]